MKGKKGILSAETKGVKWRKNVAERFGLFCGYELPKNMFHALGHRRNFELKYLYRY
jgi:hypothetical protein